MKVNLYAEEMDVAPPPTLIKKERNGVLYVGIHFGPSESDGVTIWAGSMAKLNEIMYEAAGLTH